ncbi:hypothetical protein [Pantoea agglomerans]|uniref:hypothetical protein n=1 Tax=Enterobacter agglomerans TaxID=549 RepID=UPI00320A02D1
MSARDNFFDNANKNNEADRKAKNDFNQAMSEFRDKTQSLISEIQSWFEGSSITSNTSLQTIPDSIERNVTHRVQSLLLQNGEKTLTIQPEGLMYMGGITGALKVKIINMSRSPNTQTFSLHMRDKAPRAIGVPESYEGWVIVTSSNQGRVVTVLNEENFFEAIQSFA